MDPQKALEESAERYYGRGPAIPARRLQQPRKAVPGMTRETCVVGFPVGAHLYRLLYDASKVPSRYIFFYDQFRDIGDFRLSRGEADGRWKVFTYLTTPEQLTLLKLALQTGTPVLGVCSLLTSPTTVHKLAYLLRRDGDAADKLVITLFETYDTSKVKFNGSRDWLNGVKSWVRFYATKFGLTIYRHSC